MTPPTDQFEAAQMIAEAIEAMAKSMAPKTSFSITQAADYTLFAAFVGFFFLALRIWLQGINKNMDDGFKSVHARLDRERADCRCCKSEITRRIEIIEQHGEKE